LFALAGLALVLAVDWRSAVRSFAVVLLGAAVVLLPWMIRNGRTVGVWTPVSTNNAAFACLGNQDGVSGGYADSKEALLRCFDGSVLANPSLYPPDSDFSARSPDEIGVGDFTGPPDERRWYSETVAGTAEWIAAHPRRVIALAGNKLAILVLDQPDAMETAADDGRQPVVSASVRTGIDLLNAGFQTALLLAAILGVVLAPRQVGFRLWGPPLVLTAMVVGGVAMPRFMAATAPFLSLMAAPVALGYWDAIRRPSADGRSGT
jgi:hypothetical protein